MSTLNNIFANDSELIAIVNGGEYVMFDDCSRDEDVIDMVFECDNVIEFAIIGFEEFSSPRINIAYTDSNGEYHDEGYLLDMFGNYHFRDYTTI